MFKNKIHNFHNKPSVLNTFLLAFIKFLNNFMSSKEFDVF